MKKQEKGIMNSQQAQKASAHGTLRTLIKTSVVAILMSVGINGKAQNCSINSNTVPISGTDNAAYGPGSLNNTNSGISNVGYGKNTLNALTTGDQNCGLGVNALKSITTGNGNIGVGYESAQAASSGDLNTAVGFQCQYYLTTASYNTAIGGYALHYNTTGSQNCALGVNSLHYNTLGSYNTATGMEALYNNTEGLYNTALGKASLKTNTTGDVSTAIGYSALENTTGDGNTALGAQAGYANTTGSHNTCVGYAADVNANNYSNATSLGFAAVVTASDRVFLGDANVANGDVWSYGTYNTVSDGRFKSNVSEKDVKGLEFIKLLRPVVYNFEAKKATEFLCQNMSEKNRGLFTNKDFSQATAIRQSGFIAQEVEEAAKTVNYSFDGLSSPKNNNDIYGLSYAQFVVPLVKAVQEQQAQIETDSKMISDLQKQVNELKEMIKANLGTANNATNIQTINVTDKNAIVLDQNVPNPFAESTTISYKTPASFSKAQMVITTIEGKVIKTVDIATKGEGRINIFASDLSSGVYMYSLIIDGKTMETKKLVKE